MKLGSLFSGGKDSTYALLLKLKNIACLITVLSDNPDSYMFHTSNIQLVKQQAEAMGLPIILEKTAGQKEKELADLKRAFEKAKQKYGIQGVVCGAIQSEYQFSRVKKICGELGLKVITPLWHKNTYNLMQNMIKAGLKIIITQVSADGLSTDWLGCELTKQNLEKLKKLSEKYNFNLAFEGGEAETLVTDAPFFKKQLEIIKTRREIENEFCGRLVVEIKLAK